MAPTDAIGLVGAAVRSWKTASKSNVMPTSRRANFSSLALMRDPPTTEREEVLVHDLMVRWTRAVERHHRLASGGLGSVGIRTGVAGVVRHDQQRGGRGLPGR